jgi:hypothetical protein
MESVADWYSVGKTNRRQGTTFPVFKDWYASHQQGLPIDNTTKREIGTQLGINKKGSYMTRADVIMEKIAEVDNRPEPGFWAKQMAIGRTGGKEYSQNSLKAMFGPETGIGALAGGATGVIAGGLLQGGPTYRRTAATSLGIMGAISGGALGSSIGHDKYLKGYLADRGIELKNLGFKVNLNDEAKQKYLSDKYRGGGFKS